MYKTIFLFSVFNILSSIIVFAQPYQKRELLIKNRVLEIKEYDTQQDFKTLSSIYYINDSGLVEKSIHLLFDSIIAVSPELNSLVYDTVSIETYMYDSLNREVLNSMIHNSPSGITKSSRKTEYINKNIRRVTYTDNKRTSIILIKKHTRKNCTVTRSNVDGHRAYKSLIRKYKKKSVIKTKHPVFNTPTRLYRKTKIIVITDDQGRNITQRHTYTRLFLLKKHASTSIHYEDDLMTKTCYTNTTKNHDCSFYEYKTGIKLKKK